MAAIGASDHSFGRASLESSDNLKSVSFCGDGSESDSLPLLVRMRVEFEAGRRVDFAEYLSANSVDHRASAFGLLLEQHIELRQRAGENPQPVEYLSRFPDHRDCILSVFESLSAATGSQPAEYKAPSGIPEQIGRFQVEGVLGEGGFGRVLLAFDPQLGVYRALKVPRPDHPRMRECCEIIVREGSRAAAINSRLQHSGIVAVHDLLECDGLPVLVLSYVPGMNLAEWLKSCGGRLPAGDSVVLLRELCEILQPLHEQGCLHRDLKPRNILIDRRGKVWLTDFGLSLLAFERHAGVSAFAGTPRYMSPEQMRGNFQDVDERSEIWSLGVIFHQLLSGELPSRTTGEELVGVIGEHKPGAPIRLDSSVPPELSRICDKCLRLQPGERYSSVEELMSELDAWLAQSALQGSASFADRAAAAVSATGWWRRPGVFKVRPVIGLTAICLLLCFAAFLYGMRRPSSADYVTALTAILTSMDPASALLFFPELERSKTVVIPRLRDVLQMSTVSDWKDQPLSSAVRPVAPDLHRLITDGYGVIEDRFAFCLDLPLPELLKLAESLRESGYRPTRIRPFRGQTPELVHAAAIWVRDGRRWSVQTGLTAAELPRHGEPAKFEGLVLEDLSPIPGVGGECGWLAVWVEPETPSDRRCCFADVSLAEYRSLHAIYAKKDFISQRSCQTLKSDTGDLRYTAIFSSVGPPAELHLFQSEYRLPDLLLMDLSVAELSEDSFRYLLQQIRDLTAQLEADPGNWDLLFARMRANWFAGNDAAAEADLDVLFDTGMRNIDFLHFRTLVLFRRGKFAEAEESRRLYHAMQPSPASAIFVDIVAAGCRGDEQRAVELVEQALTQSTTAMHLRLIAQAVALASDPGPELSARSTRLADLAVELFDRGLAMRPELFVDFLPDFDMPLAAHSANYQELISGHNLTVLARASTEYESRMVSAADPVALREVVLPLLSDRWRPVSIVGCGRSSTERPVADDRSVCRMLLHRPVLPESFSEMSAKQKAAAAAALIRLGDASVVWPLLDDSADPSVRTRLIRYLADIKCSPVPLFARLKIESSPSCRRSLIQCLGELAEASLLSPQQRREMTEDFLARYRNDPDPGVHSICEWALKKLGAEDSLRKLQSLLAGSQQPPGVRNWYHTRPHGNGANARPICLAVLQGPAAVQIGSPTAAVTRQRFALDGQNFQERRHLRRIDRRFAIGIHEITVDQFNAVSPGRVPDSPSARFEHLPAYRVSWFMAAEFCNRLSAAEGIPKDQWCYEPNRSFGPGLKLRANWQELTGYRLPTEAEWEFACRAGTETLRFCAAEPQILKGYARFAAPGEAPAFLPVGSLRPNGWGLFDVYGNVAEWCQERLCYAALRQEIQPDYETVPWFQPVTLAIERPLRGGSIRSDEDLVTSAYRASTPPNDNNEFWGFRVARTLR
ncbi:MAG: hypothetical protein RLZZ436_569 [Planctomycetota bacterium]|jgi:formylglycine-generating enzyme required for sulfatase activity